MKHDSAVGRRRNVTVPLFLDTIEKTNFSTWLRESDSLFGFYFILARAHSRDSPCWSVPNAAIDLRLLGFGREIPLPPLKRWFRIMWWGFGINTATRRASVLGLPDPSFYQLGLLPQAPVYSFGRLDHAETKDARVRRREFERGGDGGGR